MCSTAITSPQARRSTYGRSGVRFSHLPQVRNFRTCLPAPLARPWRWGGPRRVLRREVGPTNHRARRRVRWRPVGRSGQTFVDLPFALSHKQKTPRPTVPLAIGKDAPSQGTGPVQHRGVQLSNLRLAVSIGHDATPFVAAAYACPTCLVQCPISKTVQCPVQSNPL